jgi:hypothetical protein
MLKIHSFFPFFTFWFTPLLGLFAAGADAIASASSGAEAALAEITGGDTEVVSDDATPADESPDAQPDDQQQAAPGEPEAQQPKGDKGKMPPTLAKHLEGLADKKLAKEIKDIYYEGAQAKRQVAQFRKDFPGGRDEALQYKQTVEELEELGGREALENLRTADQQNEAIDKKFMVGDPTVVDDIISFNPESFKKLMPAILSKFHAMDKDGWNREMSSVILGEIKNSGLQMQLHLMERELKRIDADSFPQEKAELTSLVGGIKKWVEDIEKLATAKPASKSDDVDPRIKEAEQRELQAADREAKAFNTTLVSQWNSFKVAKIEAALKAHLGNKPISDEAKETVIEKTMQRVTQKLEADKTWKPSFTRLWEKGFQSGNANDLIKFCKSRSEALIPDAVKYVYGYLYGNATLGAQPKKDAAKDGKQSVNGNKPNGAAKPAGWVKLAKQPPTQLVDRGIGKTTIAMLYNDQAILRDGRKVYWGEKVPS